MPDLDLTEIGAATLIATNVILAVAAVFQLRATNRNEARRVQPVAVAHRHPPEIDLGSPTDADSLHLWRFGVSVSNEGVGVAFNVRFGVMCAGTEFPSGQGRGTRHRIQPGGTVAMVAIDVVELDPVPWKHATPRQPGDDAVFFARYEDSIGKVWRTENPGDVRADFTIRRERLWRLRELRQTRRRKRVAAAYTRAWNSRSAQSGQ